jgi:YbgC/YbaW family acyl-CoA thioester hydrolase
MVSGEEGARAKLFETSVRVRSYELDGFGHLNHAVYFNYFEHARFSALEVGGFPLGLLRDKGWGIHLAHAEADYRREAFLGQEIVVTTRVVEARSSSMTLEHTARAPDNPAVVFAEGKVVVVWVGADRRPMRIPDEVREALGLEL